MEKTYEVYIYVSLYIYVYFSLCLQFLAENCKEQKRCPFPSAYTPKCMHRTLLWHRGGIFAWIWHFSCGLWHVTLSILNYLSVMADLWQSHQCFSSAKAWSTCSFSGYSWSQRTHWLYRVRHRKQSEMWNYWTKIQGCWAAAEVSSNATACVTFSLYDFFPSIFLFHSKDKILSKNSTSIILKLKFLTSHLNGEWYKTKWK